MSSECSVTSRVAVGFRRNMSLFKFSTNFILFGRKLEHGCDFIGLITIFHDHLGTYFWNLFHGYPRGRLESAR